MTAPDAADALARCGSPPAGFLAARPPGVPAGGRQPGKVGNDATREGSAVNVRDLQQHLAEQFARAVPAATVDLWNTGTVRVRFQDNSACFVKVAHVGRADQAAPERPSWPQASTDAPAVTATIAAGGRGAQRSMRPGYLAGLVRYLLTTVEPEAATVVESFAEAGAVNRYWPPCGLKVSLGDGSAAYLAVVRVSADGDDDPNLPDRFSPEDVHGLVPVS